MPLYRSITYTTTGTKDSLNLDPSIVPFNAAITILLTGTASYKLQYSMTPFTVADTDANWFDSGDIPTATATSATTGFITPVSRIRLVIASISGSLALETNQGISTN